MRLKEVATAKFSFDELRTKGFVYVDKTDLLARLASDDDAAYFISRPRRFGKSLMLSTLKCLFEGRRNLFRGLKIEKSGWNWKKKFPVILLDMQEYRAETVDGLRDNLFSCAEKIAAQFGLDVKAEASAGMYLNSVLRAFAAKLGKFVVLVDEYDVPLQGVLGKGDEIAKARTLMHDFYVQFKSRSADIRFLMITGVSKFTKVSLFSGLNTPSDLTMNYGDYAGLLGYTHEEFVRYFGEHVRALASKRGWTEDETREKIYGWYDSYRFSPYSETRVLNPVSVGQLFKTGNFESYWAATAMSTLVYERMLAAEKTPFELDGIAATPLELDVCDAEALPYKALLYQTGYLTIKSASTDKNLRTRLVLGIPNREVRTALEEGWIGDMMHLDVPNTESLVASGRRQLASGNVADLVNETLYTLFAQIPAQWKISYEADAKRHFLLFAEMLGAKPRPEVVTARGYADAIIETTKAVYVFEFKYNRSAADAIRHIRDKGYADAYRVGKCPVTLVGINFSSRTRNVQEPKIENFRVTLARHVRISDKKALSTKSPKRRKTK